MPRTRRTQLDVQPGRTYRSADPNNRTRIKIVTRPGSSNLLRPGTVLVAPLIAGGHQARPRTITISELEASWIPEAGQ